MSPAVSVIVPVYNGKNVIAECLSRVRAQEGLERGDLELIVVDDGSTDSSAETAAPLADRVARLHQNRGAAAARNRGAREASSPLLLFVDADVFLEKDAVASLLDLFRREQDLDAAVGRYTARPGAPGLINNYHNAFTRYHHDLSPREIDWFWGALGAVKKEAFEKIGGFDELYQGASAEDMEFGRALSEAGFRIVYHPAAEGAHAHHFTLGSMLMNDYKKAALGIKLKLNDRLPGKAPGFVNVPTVASIIIVLMLAALIPALPFLNVLLVPAGLMVAALFILNDTYYRGVAPIMGELPLRAILLHWLQLGAMALGAAAGMIGRLAGRDTFGRPGWF